jgi:putative addiction module killer protein
MLEIIETSEYWRWFEALRDPEARYRIQARLGRLLLGNLGDFKSVGDGVLELRVDYGPGYRVYFMRRDRAAAVLLAGGDKSSQTRDIERARLLAKRVSEGRTWVE